LTLSQILLPMMKMTKLLKRNLRERSLNLTLVRSGKLSWVGPATDNNRIRILKEVEREIRREVMVKEAIASALIRWAAFSKTLLML